jgi:type III pantothenate kinase
LPTLEPGTDRLAGALALRELRPLPACAVHVGTAVTLDVVAADGAFVGGAIFPGIDLQLQALQTGTARLGAIANLPATGHRIGRTTADAMAFGIIRGVAWAVHGLLLDIARELTTPLGSIVISGGAAAPVIRFLRRQRLPVVADPLLALRGLACWYMLR